jgi:hypothetical protein
MLMPRKLAVAIALVFAARVWADAPKPLPAAPPVQEGAAGTILVEYFRGIAGASVADMTSNPAFPLHPSEGELIKSFEFAPEAEQYGALVRGFIAAPATGNYTFWISADDSAELYLSTDERPEHRQKIAACPTWVEHIKWDQMPEQKSQPIALTAGRKYYIEAWHKQEAGPGHLAVGWQLPDGKKELPIPGARLTPAGKPRAAEPLKINVALNPATPAATAPGQHKFPNDATVERNGLQTKMSYLIHLPNDYDKTKEKKPLFVFLCGNSHQGTNLDGILNEGPAQYLNAVCRTVSAAARWRAVGFGGHAGDGHRADRSDREEVSHRPGSRLLVGVEHGRQGHLVGGGVRAGSFCGDRADLRRGCSPGKGGGYLKTSARVDHLRVR